MSYILDALDKSEQERRLKKTPDLNSIHRQPTARTSTSRWPVILAILVSINSAGFWYWSTSRAQPNATLVEAPASDIQGNTEQQPQPVETETAQQVHNENQAPSLRNQVTSSNVVSIRPDAAPVQLSMLPMSVQAQIPDLKFSSHLFSEDASFRMVNINGKMIKEGESVTEELLLVEITEEGVVLNYLHHTFEVSVLADWSFN